MDAPGQHHEPDKLPHPIAIAIIGETALDHLHELAQQMQDNLDRALAEDPNEN